MVRPVSVANEPVIVVPEWPGCTGDKGSATTKSTKPRKKKSIVVPEWPGCTGDKGSATTTSTEPHKPQKRKSPHPERKQKKRAKHSAAETSSTYELPPLTSSEQASELMSTVDNVRKKADATMPLYVRDFQKAQVLLKLFWMEKQKEIVEQRLALTIQLMAAYAIARDFVRFVQLGVDFDTFTVGDWSVSERECKNFMFYEKHSNKCFLIEKKRKEDPFVQSPLACVPRASYLMRPTRTDDQVRYNMPNGQMGSIFHHFQTVCEYRMTNFGLIFLLAC